MACDIGRRVGGGREHVVGRRSRKAVTAQRAHGPALPRDGSGHRRSDSQRPARRRHDDGRQRHSALRAAARPPARGEAEVRTHVTAGGKRRAVLSGVRPTGRCRARLAKRAFRAARRQPPVAGRFGRSPQDAGRSPGILPLSLGGPNGAHRPVRTHPGAERPRTRGRPARDQEGDDRQARHADRRGGAARRCKILCLQELFYGPYFCAEQETRWYDLTERVPDGPTVTLMQKLAKKHKMVMVVPDLRGRAAGRLLQHRRGDRRRRHVPRQVPQDPHPALQAGLLGEVLLPPRQPRLPGVRDRLRQGRRLHLLRPALPRGRARARA